jgi:very-short-patch-repair endonuclease
MKGLLAMAERQYGVFTRAQAVEAGLSQRQIDHRLSTGLFEKMHPGVYRVSGSYRSARQRASAMCLWCGSDALLSFVTAASVLKLPSLPSERFYISAPQRILRTSCDLVLHRPTNLIARDRIQVDGLPCTSGTRTIIDLASMLDDEALEHAFDTARRFGLTTRPALERRVADFPRIPKGVQHILTVASARPTESVLEVKAVRLLRQHNLFPPATQFPVGDYRIDFAWPDLPVGLEPEGFDAHGTRLAWKHDRRRVAILEAAGWRLVQWTWDDVTRHPEEAIARLRSALVL